MKRKRQRTTIIKEDVVLCGKKITGGNVVLWVLADPTIRANARSLPQAEEQLVNKVWSACEPDEPFAIKYEEDGPACSGPEALFWVGPNGTIDAETPGQYFKEGFCFTCQMGKGGRNARPLELDKVPKGLRAGLNVRFQPFLRCGMRVEMLLIHATIGKKMKEVCDPLVEFHPVRDKERGVTEFFEIIPTRCIPEASPRGKKIPVGNASSVQVLVCTVTQVDCAFLAGTQI